MDQITTLLRGLFRRCPNCGESHVFRRWLTMVDRCPRCGLYFEREEGYWTGAIAINTIVTEMVFAAMLVIVMVRTWPDIPMVPLIIAGVAMNVIVPFLFYPISKTLWVALDLVLHPLEPKEQREVQTIQRVRETVTPE